MSSTDPRAITLSPGLVSTSSGEVERVLSALVARREPLAARLAGGADSRWKLRLVRRGNLRLGLGLGLGAWVLSFSGNGR